MVTERKTRSDKGKTRKRQASDRLATEALRKKVQNISGSTLAELSGVSTEVISRFRTGGNIRSTSAAKLAEAVEKYQPPAKVRTKKVAESDEASDRCAYLILENGEKVALGDLDDIRARERLICSWCYKPHEGEGCKEEDLEPAQRIP